jgi:hypothetical protein
MNKEESAAFSLKKRVKLVMNMLWPLLSGEDQETGAGNICKLPL